MHMAKIDVISSCLVPVATNTSISRMELTPWDLELILLDPIQKGIFFHKPKSQELQKHIINHLKNSLSRTLDFFPPLAGRLGTKKYKNNTTCYFIDSNNAGAKFTHATAAGAVSVSDILDPTYTPEIVSSLFPLNGIRNFEGVSKPLLGVQVTEFVDGYFIACTANHVIVDGTSFWHFFNTWSEISRGFDKISKNPILERWFPTNIANHDIPLPPLEQNLLRDIATSPPLLERVFHFSRENVAKLKSRANSEAGSEKISSLQALSAHLWRSVVRARHIQSVENPTSKEINYFLMVGARPRIPLPEGYFGNAVYVARTAINEAEVLQNGLGFAALKINELVSKQTKEVIVKFVEDWVKNPTIWTKSSVNFIISSSPRFDVYGNDFGWGKPIAVRSGKGQKVDGKMTVFPAATTGGIDVEVCLMPETLHAMVDDAEFMEATD